MGGNNEIAVNAKSNFALIFIASFWYSCQAQTY